MAKIKRIAMQDKYKLLRTIETNGKKDGDLWVYNDGWSDAKIAAMFKVNTFVVGQSRQKMFGCLRRGPEPGSDLKAQIAALEERIAALENAMTSPPDVNENGHARPVVAWR